MNIEPQELMKRISQLPDQNLLRVVYIEPDKYRPEAITYAEAEIERRGISTNEGTKVNTTDKTAESPLETFGRKVWKIIKDKSFWIGFAIGPLPFIWLNNYSYNQMYKVNCDDCFVFFGFPFYLYQTGGFAGPTIILWNGLIANVVVALCASICTGWILKRLLCRINARHRAD
jgi:hypothetical protein